MAPVARLLAAGLTDLVRSEFGSVLREISCDVVASSAAAAGDDEERYGRDELYKNRSSRKTDYQ